MEYVNNIDSESEQRSDVVSELSFNLLTPASSRATSPIDYEIINQDPLSEPRNFQTKESLTGLVCTNSHVNSIIVPISRLGNDLKIIRKIGSGSFGDVIEVHHQIDMQFHALKCIPLKNENKENRIKIMKEAKTLAELKHENLLRYGDSWIDNYPYENILSWENNDNCSSTSFRTPMLCILTELCDTNLTQLIEADLYKHPSRARNIFWKIAEGLAYLHAKGFIHGDLKPDNILIKKIDTNKKSDCGVCLQMCYSSSRLPCRHICCSVCEKVISIERKQCAICQVKIPFGYFNSTDKENEVYQWKFQGTKRWWPYDGNNNIALEDAFNAGKLECTVIVKQTMYRINFQHMVQMQETDRTKSRKIMREPPHLIVKDDDVDDVKIGDFGLTKLASDFSAHSTQKEDMYSLGVILLEMFLYSLIDEKIICWNTRQKMENALRNKDPENAGLIYILKRLLNEDSRTRPTCDELLGPIKRGFEQMLRGRKRQAEQLNEDNTKRMRETKLR